MSDDVLLWVTSFGPDMYAASGRALLDSFVSRRPDGRLLAAVEGLEPASVVRPGVDVLSLDGDPFLVRFLAEQADVIPAHLGGRAPEPHCRCPGGPYGPHDRRHRLPCLGHWFCRNFSRWFRKVAALRLAVRVRPDAGLVVWVDADCRFRRHVDVATVRRSWFAGDRDVFYLKAGRPVMETGVVGYRGAGGRAVLERLVDRYRSGRFRSDPRWDDSYQTQEALAESGRPAVDLAWKVGPHAAVVPYSALAAYLEHDKGRHGRRLGLMT